MGAPSRRWYASLGTLCGLVAVVVAAGIVFAFPSGQSRAAPTKSQYFARVAAICQIYGPKLDKVPPPVDVSIPSEITASVTKVEPVLKEEARAVSRLRPPRELRSQLARWNKLNDSSIAKLGEVLRAAKKVDLRGIQVAYVQFIVTGAKAQHLGHKIGFPSPPC